MKFSCEIYSFHDENLYMNKISFIDIEANSYSECKVLFGRLMNNLGIIRSSVRVVIEPSEREVPF